MNEAMPRPRPPLHSRSLAPRQGDWVVRIGQGPRTRLRAPYGTPEFEAEYPPHAAIRGEPARGPRRASAGTLRWLCDHHRASSAWAALSPATRRQRENIMAHVLERAGACRSPRRPRRSSVDGRERRARRQPGQQLSPTPCARSSGGRSTPTWSRGIRRRSEERRRPKTGGFTA